MAAPPLSYRRLMAVPHLPALLLAITLSRLAGRMLSLTIVLYALARFGSPALAGWLAFAAIAPGLAISPVAGALLDRMSAGRAVALDMTASAMLILALIAADLGGVAAPPVLVLLLAIFSLTSPLSVAGVRTLLPRLVPPEALDRANALDTATHAVVDVAGPALAGGLVALAGPLPALGAIVLAFAAAGMCIVRVPRLPRLAPSGALLRQTLEGIRAVATQPTLRGLAVSYALYQVTWGILVVVVPVSAARDLGADGGDWGAGLLWSAMGLAGAVGALTAGQLRTLGRERSAMALGMAATGLAAWPLAASFGLAGLVMALMVVGFAAGPVDVGLLTLRQRRTDPAQLGRVLSVSISVNLAGFPLGSALGGALVGHSLHGALLVAALASVLGALAVAAIPRD